MSCHAKGITSRQSPDRQPDSAQYAILCDGFVEYSEQVGRTYRKVVRTGRYTSYKVLGRLVLLSLRIATSSLWFREANNFSSSPSIVLESPVKTLTFGWTTISRPQVTDPLFFRIASRILRFTLFLLTAVPNRLPAEIPNRARSKPLA